MKKLELPKKIALELGTKDSFSKVKIGNKELSLDCLNLPSEKFQLENLIATIIADALTTYNKLPILPSQLVEDRERLIECLENIKLLGGFSADGTVGQTISKCLNSLKQ